MKTCGQCGLRYPNEAVYCFVDGQDLITLKDSRIGTTIAGRYQIEAIIGEGGMATVYQATQKVVERACAIKIMNATLARDPVVRERFRREARSARKLAHPNIIEIFDQGETEDGTAYIALELLVGCSLGEEIGKAPLPLSRALGIMIQIARGIARAHDLDVLHRDLKPDNIFVSRRDDGSDLVKLLDFGIALSKQDLRLTGAGEIFGTAEYMAPERITAGEPGTAGDLYSLGVIFFELVTGVLPFEAQDITGFFRMHLQAKPRSPRSLNRAVPVPLEDLILRLLAKEPKDRPVDAHRVHQDLLDIARDMDVAVPLVPETQAETERTMAALPKAGRGLAVDQWAKRAQIFQEMLVRAYGASVPADMSALLSEIRELVPRIVALRASSAEEQRALTLALERGRAARQRFGFAVDALGVDASKRKEDVRDIEVRLVAAKERTAHAMRDYKAAHGDILVWEGRSAFQEPYADLAQAYRTGAAAMDEWIAARREERVAEALLETHERTATDLEYQIRALRSALAVHEKEIEDEQRTREKDILVIDKQVDRLESELFQLAAAFCKPLRSRPELAPVFQKLESHEALNDIRDKRGDKRARGAEGVEG